MTFLHKWVHNWHKVFERSQCEFGLHVMSCDLMACMLHTYKALFTLILLVPFNDQDCITSYFLTVKLSIFLNLIFLHSNIKTEKQRAIDSEICLLLCLCFLNKYIFWTKIYVIRKEISCSMIESCVGLMWSLYVALHFSRFLS